MQRHKSTGADFRDPRNVAEVFVNEAISLYIQEDNVYLTLGVDRPAADTQTGSNFQVDREVVARIVMPTATAKKIMGALQVSLGPLGQVPLNRPLQS